MESKKNSHGGARDGGGREVGTTQLNIVTEAKQVHKGKLFFLCPFYHISAQKPSSSR